MRKTIFRFVRHKNGNPGWGRWADPMTKSRVQVLKESTIFSEDKIEDSDNEILNVDDVRISNRLFESHPPAIFCIGLNYKKHAKETGFPEPKYPVLFLKNPATFCGEEDEIEIPKIAALECDYECERTSYSISSLKIRNTLR